MVRQAGTVYLTIYRPDKDGTKTLISKTKVDAASSGEFVHMLTVNEYVVVHPGYHIGYHYPSGVSPMISEVHQDYLLNNMPYSEDQLSARIAVPQYDDQLPIGSKLGPALHSARALTTFEPIIQCEYVIECFYFI